ncbi:MAG: hypothetical protein M3472_02800, partial [Chloroflexota bacterium]|nr:hypothetical protein [Chloroflexota bacterium]
MLQYISHLGDRRRLRVELLALPSGQRSPAIAGCHRRMAIGQQVPDVDQSETGRATEVDKPDPG